MTIAQMTGKMLLLCGRRKEGRECGREEGRSLWPIWERLKSEALMGHGSSNDEFNIVSKEHRVRIIQIHSLSMTLGQKNKTFLIG
jgi:hypothetical protein